MLKNNFEFILFLCIASFITLSFIPYGFNPTDDGLFLAAAKRIQIGQIPHIDFISVRPAGTAILHSFFTSFFPENLFLITRYFNGMQFSIIVLIWLKIITNTLNIKLQSLTSFFLLLIAFMLSLHDAPFMSWATIDGLFFASIAIYLIISKNKNNKYIGYFIFGCICKVFPILFLIPLDLKRKGVLIAPQQRKIFSAFI